MDAPVATPSASMAQLMQRRRRSWLAAFAGALGVVAVLGALWWWLYASRYQSTDDAYVAGDLVSVMPQVSGTVVAIAADETDLVYAGQELVRLDATDARIALADAEQQLARTVRQTRTVFDNRDQLAAVVGQRRADLDRAPADYARRAAHGHRAARAVAGGCQLQGGAAQAHAHRPAGEPHRRPLRRAGRVPRQSRGARPRHRRGVRAAAGAERHRQLDQGRAARAG